MCIFVKIKILFPIKNAQIIIINGYKNEGTYFAHHQLEGALSKFPLGAGFKSFLDFQISGFEFDKAGLLGKYVNSTDSSLSEIPKLNALKLELLLAN